MKYFQTFIYFFAGFFFLSVLPSLSQTLVRGKILDAKDKSPVPFANISFVGSGIGTSAAVDGAYSLQTTESVDSIYISFVGYESQTIPVTQGKRNSITVLLSESVQLLEGATLVSSRKKDKSDSPALRIMKQVWKNKDNNNQRNTPVQRYKRYEKTRLDINNFGDKFKNNRMLDDFEFIFQYADTSTMNGKTFLPMLINESVFQIYQSDKPKEDYSLLLSSQLSGFNDNKSAQEFLESLQIEFNIFDPTITLFEKVFSNPLSSFGNLNYFYYLEDSVVTAEETQYHIQFVPKRTNELAFLGDMYINKSDWGVANISLQVDRSANLNFVSELEIFQSFERDERIGKYLQKENSLIADLQLLNLKGELGFYGRKQILFSDYHFERDWNQQMIDSLSKIQFLPPAQLAKNVDAHRPFELSARDSGVYNMVKTIKEIPKFRSIERTSFALISQYIPFSDFKFQIGPLWSLYSRNIIEGNRFLVGGTTLPQLSNKWRLNAYLAYGDRDKTFKYKFNPEFLISRSPYSKIGFNLQDDFQVLTINDPTSLLGAGSILTTIFPNQVVNNLVKVKEEEVYGEFDYKTKYRFRLGLSTREMTQTDALRFDFLNQSGLSEKAFNSSEARFRFIFDPQAYFLREYSTHRTQLFINTRLRIILNAQAGLKDVLGGDYSYEKYTMRVNIRQPINLLGLLRFEVEAGNLRGDLPYPLLFLAPGNQTNAFSFRRFNVLNEFEFVSDRYASLFVEHNFEGLFFNHIPLLKKLKWREVVTVNGLYGSLRPNNRQTISGRMLRSPDSNGGYWEVGVGVMNIFKFLRIDYIQRLSYRNNGSFAGPNSAIKFRFVIRV